MEDIFCEQFDNDNGWHQQDVYSISYWSKQSESVLPVHHSEILCDHPYGVLAQCPGGVLGYIAVKELSLDGKLGQVGSLITHPYYQNNGVASELVEHVIEVAPKRLPDMQVSFAYGNEKSTSLFEKHGGVVVGDRDPPAATGCNNVIELTDAMGLPGIEGFSLSDVIDMKPAGNG